MTSSNNKDFWKEDPRVDEFLAEIAEVCKKYNLSISPEDRHSGFIIEPYDKRNIATLLGAWNKTEL